MSIEYYEIDNLTSIEITCDDCNELHEINAVCEYKLEEVLNELLDLGWKIHYDKKNNEIDITLCPNCIINF
jgi:hypothetical protein